MSSSTLPCAGLRWRPRDSTKWLSSSIRRRQGRRLCVLNSIAVTRHAIPTIIVCLLIIACSPQIAPSPTPAPSQTPEPTSALPVDEQVKVAFAEVEPQARRMKVLAAVQRLLDDPAVQSLSDADATSRLTDLAFASGAIRL